VWNERQPQRRLPSIASAPAPQAPPQQSLKVLAVLMVIVALPLGLDETNGPKESSRSSLAATACTM
jgi:hypothetical protein